MYMNYFLTNLLNFESTDSALPVANAYPNSKAVVSNLWSLHS